MLFYTIPMKNITRFVNNDTAYINVQHSRDAEKLNGLTELDYSPFVHTHYQYLLKSNISDYEFETKSISGIEVQDLTWKVHTHPQYVNRQEPVLSAANLYATAGNKAPGDFASVEHDHDGVYWKRLEVGDDSKGLIDDHDSASTKTASDFALADHTHAGRYLLAWEEAKYAGSNAADHITSEYIASDTQWLVVGDKYYSARDFASFLHNHGDLYANYKSIISYQLVPAPIDATLGTVGSTDKLEIYRLATFTDVNSNSVAIANNDLSYLQAFVGSDYPEKFVPLVYLSLYNNAEKNSATITVGWIEGYVTVGKTSPIGSWSGDVYPVVIPVNNSVEYNTFTSVNYGIRRYYDATNSMTTLYVVGFPAPDGGQQVIKFQLLVMLPV